MDCFRKYRFLADVKLSTSVWCVWLPVIVQETEKEGKKGGIFMCVLLCFSVSSNCVSV